MKFNFINGYKIYAFKNKQELLECLVNKKKILVAMNAEKILKKDEKLKEIVNNNIGYPDGIGAVMALKQKGVSSVKIAGAEFWLDIIKTFYKTKTFYLIGATNEVINSVVDKLKTEFQGINIVGFRNGYFNENDKEKLKKDIIALQPDIVFVAQGSPRQEYLMADLLSVYPALYMGLGGSFDVYCGVKKRAPKLFINLNLEWLYRLLKEPTRAKRQLVLLKFLFLMMFRRL